MTIKYSNQTYRIAKVALLIAGTLGFSANSAAQEPGFGDTFQGWSGTASLGATSSTGNSESSNINGSIRLGKTVNRWEHLVFGSVFKGSATIIITEDSPDGGTTRRIVKGDNSNRIALGYQPKFYYSPKTYFFGILDYEQDKPALIDSATRQIIGVGHRFYANDSGFFSAEIGIGNKNTSLTTGDDVNGAIGYLGLNYLNRISETVTFNADLRSDFGSDNTFVEIGLGVAFKVSEKLAFKIAHFSRSNSDLSSPDGSDSDSVTTINLVVDI